MTCRVIKAEILNYSGDFQNASEQIENILKEIDNQEFPLIYLDALLQKSYVFYRIGKIEECISLNEKCEQLIQTLKKSPTKVLAKRKAIIIFTKANISEVRGNNEESSDYLLEALTFAKECEDEQLITYILLSIGLIHQFMGNLEEAEEYYHQGLKIAEKIGNKQLIARAYSYFGWLYNIKNENEQALTFLKKSLKFAEESGSKRDFHWIYDAFGILYLNIFELDKALEFSKKQIALRKEDLFTQNALTRIGQIYQLKGDFKQAIEYYKKALKICEEIGDKKRILPKLLFNLVTASIANNEMLHAQGYVDYLHQISIEVNDKQVDIYYRLTSALLLKTNTRMQKWVEAIQLLEGVLAEEGLSPYLSIIALLNLSELLLKELQLSGIGDVLKDIERNFTLLYAIAEKGHFYNLLIDTLRLQSQIALVELNPQKALQLLSQALIISKDKGLKKLTEEITLEQQKLNDQISKWEGFQEKRASVSETLKHVKLENGIKRISKETVLEVKDEETGKVIEYRKLFVLKI